MIFFSEVIDSATEVLDSAEVSESTSAVEITQVEIDKKLNALQQFIKDLPDKLMAFGIKFVFAVVIFIIGVKIISIIRKIVKKSLELREAELGVRQFLDSAIKGILYFVLIVWLASYFGFQTTSLIALLGSAGVALALALQGSLSNVTGGILILLLKPFKVGDYIIEDNKGNEGTVVEIQLFYTRLRTVDEKIVVIPNGTLANTSLTNINASPDRRITIKVGVAYDSNLDKCKKVIKKTIVSNDSVDQSRDIRVVVDSLDASAVTIASMFYVKNEEYFAVKWQLTEDIKLALDKAGIVIPFNQLDVHMVKE